MTTTTTNNIFGGFSADQSPRSLRSILVQYWWLIAFRGVIGIIFGMIALIMPVATIIVLVLLFAAYMLMDGAVALYGAYQAARQRRAWGLLVLQGLANLVAGLIAVLWPDITVLAFVLLIAAWAIVSGLLQIVAAFHVTSGRWWLAFGGVISLIYGGSLVLAPYVGALVMTWWMGAWAVVFGALLIAAAFRLRLHRDESPSIVAA